MDKTRTVKLDLRTLGWFLALAFGIAWALELPMLLDGRGLNPPWAMLYSAVNFAPALAAFIVVRWIRPLQGARKAMGLQFGVPGSRWGLYWLFGRLGFVAFGVAAPFVGALFGLFPMDLTDFSLYRESLQNAPGGEAFLGLGSIQTVVLVVLLTLPLWALLLTPFSLGEGGLAGLPVAQAPAARAVACAAHQRGYLGLLACAARRAGRELPRPPGPWHPVDDVQLHHRRHHPGMDANGVPFFLQGFPAPAGWVTARLGAEWRSYALRR